MHGQVYNVTVGGVVNKTVTGLKAEEAGTTKTVLVGENFSQTVGETHKVTAKKIVMEAEDEILEYYPLHRMDDEAVIKTTARQLTSQRFKKDV